MKILIVGVGALGGTIAARAVSAGMPVWLATRSADAARALQVSGLRLTGIGGPAQATSINVAALESYKNERFDLILLATKVQDALDLAPFLASLLTADGVLFPIQNGGVSQILAEQLGPELVLGGLSNLAATMLEPGVYEQRNAGNLLIGALPGGSSEQANQVASVLRQAIDIRVTANVLGSVWAKLIINCAVTTVGAVASQTMRQYMQTLTGKEVFRHMYDEALSVAEAIGVMPERLHVEPIPPSWSSKGKIKESDDYDNWENEVIGFYGDLKPSMLQDFERGKKTEIDFINGYVARLGKETGISVTMNSAITEMVHKIEQGCLQPAPNRLDDLLRALTISATSPI